MDTKKKELILNYIAKELPDIEVDYIEKPEPDDSKFSIHFPGGQTSVLVIGGRWIMNSNDTEIKKVFNGNTIANAIKTCGDLNVMVSTKGIVLGEFI